jgi:hypothetical protein
MKENNFEVERTTKSERSLVANEEELVSSLQEKTCHAVCLGFHQFNPRERDVCCGDTLTVASM